MAIALTYLEEEEDEEVVVTMLIAKGLLKILADMLQREDYQKFHPKVCAILSNIACDTEENRLRLIESEAFQEAIGMGIHDDLITRYNVIGLIVNIIVNAPSRIAV